MSTDLGVGDADLPYVDVAPADTDTEVTLTVTKPDGTSGPIGASGGTLTAISGTTPQQYAQRWTADTPITYDQPGRWILAWTVTGTGEGAETLDVFVVPNPTAGGPTWAPGRSRVAAYVPRRTLVRSAASIVGSQDSYLFTFDGTTIPRGVEVDRLIADGVAWVSARVNPMHASSEGAASVAAALYAAAMLERNWPEDDQALQRANDLERRLDLMLTDLAVSNQAALDKDAGEGDFAVEIVPYWSYPPADPRYDTPTYW